MDDTRLTTFSRTLFATPTRRLTVRTLAALGAAVVTGRGSARAKKKGRKHKRDNGAQCPELQCPEPGCAAACTGKTCGPDGCGGSCGACLGGKCRSGICDCSGGGGGKDLCGGNCVTPCRTGTVRNPYTCACCPVNGETSACPPSGLSDRCCSGLCDPDDHCLGSTGSCQFDAQCQSGVCQVNGTCA